MNELLKEMSDLKEHGLTAVAVVIDFVFCCLQPLKERSFPAYLYVGAKDPNRELPRTIFEEEVRARMSLMLKTETPTNNGSPQPHSIWHLSPSCSVSTLIPLD